MNTLDWFKEAKFGMMIHWGLYALPAGEWKGRRMADILRNYGELCLIWFDNPLTISKEQSLELYSLVKKYQPGCLLNSRLGSGACDYRSLGDNEIGYEFVGEELVETPATLNDTWGYKSFDQNWKTAEQVLALKTHLNERGINYLLNVGPDYLGRIPGPSVEILRQVGRSEMKLAQGV